VLTAAFAILGSDGEWRLRALRSFARKTGECTNPSPSRLSVFLIIPSLPFCNARLVDCTTVRPRVSHPGRCCLGKPSIRQLDWTGRRIRTAPRAQCELCTGPRLASHVRECFDSLSISRFCPHQWHYARPRAQAEAGSNKLDPCLQRHDGLQCHDRMYSFITDALTCRLTFTSTGTA